MLKTLANVINKAACSAFIGGSLLYGAAHPAFAADDFTLSVDKYYSPYMGSNWLIAGLRGYEILDNILFSPNVGAPTNWMAVGRTAKWLVEFTLCNWAMVVQHEAFGHGFRGREFKLEPLNYKLNLFRGSTSFNQTNFNNLTSNQRAAYAAGGAEATSILAMELQNTWWASGNVDYRDATMFLVNALDQSTYVFSAVNKDFHPDVDLNSYISYVNQWQGPGVLTDNNLRFKIAWDWLNPMFYISAYSIFKYFWLGTPHISMDTWHIGAARFMPTTRTLLAPWGPEWQLQLHLFTEQARYTGIYLRGGRTGGKNSYGLDLINKPMANYNCWQIINKLSAWYQPHLNNTVNAALNTNKWGFADFISVVFNASNNVSFFGELGYKLSGYLPGTQLERGVIWRVGFNFELGLI